MKKIAAFITAAVLFVVCIVIVNFAVADNLTTNNSRYGTWINKYKDKSYDAITSNIEEDTMLLMGSSEFQHGRKTKYHPSRIFRKQNMNVMCIGAAYNQSLSHATTLAAIGPELTSKKVVLLVSPSWFKKDGVDKGAFSTRFSETEYAKMLENPNISEETKKAIADRTVDMLSADHSTQKTVKRYNKVAEGDGNPVDELINNISISFTSAKDNLNAFMAWRRSGQEYYKKYKKTSPKTDPPDWSKLTDDAEVEFADNLKNPFFMSEQFYEKKIQPIVARKKNSSSSKSYAVSPEYDDFRLFLDVCREQDMEVMVVILPLNGYWYDYTGFPKEGRDKCIEQIQDISDEYGVMCSNLYGESYTEGFFEDAVHPTGKGWVTINEKIYEFFSK